jgi:hypothetical protein
MLCYLGFEPLVQAKVAWDSWRPRFLKRIDSRDSDGNTALQLAIRGGNETVVRLLVDRGADIEAKNKYAQTMESIRGVASGAAGTPLPVSAHGQDPMLRLRTYCLVAHTTGEVRSLSVACNSARRQSTLSMLHNSSHECTSSSEV